MKMHVLLSALLLGIILISGCTQYSPQLPAPTGGQQEGGQEPTGELKEFTVEGSEFRFSPASLTVNKGDRVKITFKNVGSIGHNFVIVELGISTRVIAPGAIETVEFTANTTGTFLFYCSVGTHRASGMEGQLTVS